MTAVRAELSGARTPWTRDPIASSCPLLYHCCCVLCANLPAFLRCYAGRNMGACWSLPDVQFPCWLLPFLCSCCHTAVLPCDAFAHCWLLPFLCSCCHTAVLPCDAFAHCWLFLCSCATCSLGLAELSCCGSGTRTACRAEHAASQMRQQQAPSAAETPAAAAPGKAAGAATISLHACAASPAGPGADMAPDGKCGPAAAPPAMPAAQRPAPPCAPPANGCAYAAASRGQGGAASSSAAETAFATRSPRACRQAEGASSRGAAAPHTAEPASPRMRQVGSERMADGGPGSPLSPGGEDAAGRVLRKRKRRHVTGFRDPKYPKTLIRS